MNYWNSKPVFNNDNFKILNYFQKKKKKKQKHELMCGKGLRKKDNYRGREITEAAGQDKKRN